MEADCSKLLKEAEEYLKNRRQRGFASGGYVSIVPTGYNIPVGYYAASVLAYEEAMTNKEILEEAEARKKVHFEELNQHLAKFRKSYKGK